MSEPPFDDELPATARPEGADPAPGWPIAELDHEDVPASVLVLSVTAPLLAPYAAGRGRPATGVLPEPTPEQLARAMALIPHSNPATGLPLEPTAARPRTTDANGPDRGRPDRDRPDRDRPDRDRPDRDRPENGKPTAAQAPHGRSIPVADTNAPAATRPDAAAGSGGRTLTVERWARRFVQALIEVLDGDRPAPQLLRCVAPAVYEHVLRTRRTCSRPVRGPGGTARAAVRSMRITTPAPGVAEVAVRYSVSDESESRCKAAAFRVEAAPEQWLCTALELG